MFWILQVVQSFKIIKFKINCFKSNFYFCFGFLKDSLNVSKFKRNFQKLIMISLFDTSSIVESFKIIKFKRKFKKIIMIFVLDTSSWSKFSKL